MNENQNVATPTTAEHAIPDLPLGPNPRGRSSLETSAPVLRRVSEDRALSACPTCGRPISAAPAAPGIASLRPNSEASLEATVAAVGPTREVVTSRGAAEVADTGPVHVPRSSPVASANRASLGDLCLPLSVCGQR